ncbi:MAG: hypothetical protein WCN88_04885 [Candidatus Falkowbacteria bacterium]
MKIIYIDHKDQRYDTAGDYIKIDGEWTLYISKLSNHRYELCVTLHEVIECYLCDWFGIKEEDISAFDIEYERNRPEGDLSEPGFDKNAPYRTPHIIATVFEWLFSKILFVSWKKYSEDIYKLEY